AGPVLDNDLLAERRRELGGDDPADGINPASGRKRDDQRDRTGGIVLTRCGRAAGERDERGAEKRGCVIQSKHSNSPSLSTPPRPSRRAAEQRDEVAALIRSPRRRAQVDYPAR